MGTLRLTLLRHGQAESVDACADDFERALTRKGTAEAQEMATRIVRRDLIPDLILVSPAERAWATASIVAATCELDAKRLQCARELYLAMPDTIWHSLTRCPDSFEHVLICGHNPGLSEIASRLGPTSENRNLPTAGLATAVWHDGRWATLEAEFADACDTDDPDSLADLWP